MKNIKYVTPSVKVTETSLRTGLLAGSTGAGGGGWVGAPNRENPPQEAGSPAKDGETIPVGGNVTQF